MSELQVINPFLFTIKNTQYYEQNSQDHPPGTRLHHRRHPRRGRRSNADVGIPTIVMKDTRFKISQYACAVLLIVSSIALVSYQVVEIDDVASGLLYYVAQSFLLAGSIFGLDQYLRIINKHYHENKP